MAERKTSHSRLDLWAKCGGAYAFRYVPFEDLPDALKVMISCQEDIPPDRSSHEAKIGKLVHLAAQVYNGHLVSKMLAQDVPAMAGIANDVFFGKHPLVQKLKPKDRPKMDPSARTEVLEICETLAVNQQLDWMHVVGMEDWFTMKLAAPSGPWLFRGYIDLDIIQDRHARVIDYKSGHRVESQAEVDENPQMKRYGLAVCRKYPQVQTLTVTLRFCRFGIDRHCEFRRADLEAYEPQLIDEIEQVASDTEYTCTEGSFCDWCSYPAICPAIHEAIRLGDKLITCDDDAIEVGCAITGLDRHRKRLNAEARSWSSAHGPFRAGDKVFGFFPTEKTEFPDAQAVASTAKAGGLNVWDFLRVDAKALNKAVLAEGSAELLKAIQRLGKDASGTSFKSKKWKPQA